jgi:hypothetical protein
MKLEELEPEFLRLVSKDAWMAISDTILSSRVSGIRFRCPSCTQFETPHYIICWRPDVSPQLSPNRGRWEFSGKFLHDLTFSGPISCEVCKTNFFVDSGEVKVVSSRGNSSSSCNSGSAS